MISRTVPADLIAMHAIGKALTKDQQLFVTNNLVGVVEFLYSEEGKKAIQNFVMEWQTAPSKKAPD